MWTTLDGLELRVSPAALRRLAARHRQSGIADLVRRAYTGSLLPAVGRALSRLAGAAYSSGSVVGRSGRRYRRFEAQLGGRTYRLFARPLGGGRYGLVAVRPGPEGEATVAVHGGEVTVQWSPPMPLEQAMTQDGGGVYILERDGVPVYVGEGDTFRTVRNPAGGVTKGRLTGRHEHLRQSAALPGLTVRLGTIPAGQNTERGRAMVEHTAILDLNAALAAQHRPALTNMQSVEAYRVRPEGVTIHHAAAVPPHLAGLPADRSIPGGRLQHIRGPRPGDPLSRRIYQPPTQLPLIFPPPTPRPAPPQAPPAPSPQLNLPFGAPARQQGRVGAAAGGQRPGRVGVAAGGQRPGRRPPPRGGAGRRPGLARRRFRRL